MRCALKIMWLPHHNSVLRDRLLVTEYGKTDDHNGPPIAVWSPPSFLNYRFDAAYDEMFGAPALPREHYQSLHRTLLGLPPEELRKSQQAADLTFLHEGITFTVYGSKEGTGRIFPTVIRSKPLSAENLAEFGQQQQQ